MRKLVNIPRLFLAVFVILLAANYFALGSPFKDEWRGKARGLNNLGLAYQDAGRIEDARFLYIAAIKKSRGYTHPYINLGTVAEIYGYYDEAATLYRYALKIDPGEAIAAYNLGACLLRLGGYDEAMTNFRKVDNYLKPQALNDIGCIYLLQGKKSEAIATFQEAAEKNSAEAKKNLLRLASK
jgi:tetratricopeptide (TPR) repeat protein